MARKDKQSEVSIHDTATEHGEGMDIQWTTERTIDRFGVRRVVSASITPHPRGNNPHPRNGH